MEDQHEQEANRVGENSQQNHRVNTALISVTQFAARFGAMRRMFKFARVAATAAGAMMLAAAHADQEFIESGRPIAVLLPTLKNLAPEASATSETLLLDASFEPLPVTALSIDSTHLPELDADCDGLFVIPGIIDARNPGFSPCGELVLGKVEITVSISYSEGIGCLGLAFLTANLEEQITAQAREASNSKISMRCSEPEECVITDQLVPGVYHTHVQTQLVTDGCTMFVDVCARIEVLSGTIGICGVPTGPTPAVPWEITPPCGCPRLIAVPEGVR